MQRPSECGSTWEVVTAAIDDYVSGNDTSYDVGDHSSSSLTIPTAPTAKAKDRYKARLCGARVKEGDYLVGIEQWLYLGVTVDVEGDDDDEWPYELITPVTDFLWKPANGGGNVAWGLTLIPEAHLAPAGNPSTPARSNDPYALDSSFLVDPVDVPQPGKFPGQPLAGLGLFRDLRFGVASPYHATRIRIPETGAVVFWASIKQMLNVVAEQGADSLPTPPENQATGGLIREDLFLIAQQALDPKYRYVGGRLIFEVGRCCDSCCHRCGPRMEREAHSRRMHESSVIPAPPVEDAP